MTIKIKTAVAITKWEAMCFADIECGRLERVSTAGSTTKVRIVRDSDWRKLMALVKAVDDHDHADPSKVCDICEALVALEKKK